MILKTSMSKEAQAKKLAQQKAQDNKQKSSELSNLMEQLAIIKARQHNELLLQEENQRRMKRNLETYSTFISNPLSRDKKLEEFMTNKLASKNKQKEELAEQKKQEEQKVSKLKTYNSFINRPSLHTSSHEDYDVLDGVEDYEDYDLSWLYDMEEKVEDNVEKVMKYEPLPVSKPIQSYANSSDVEEEDEIEDVEIVEVVEEYRDALPVSQPYIAPVVVPVEVVQKRDSLPMFKAMPVQEVEEIEEVEEEVEDVIEDVIEEVIEEDMYKYDDLTDTYHPVYEPDLYKMGKMVSTPKVLEEVEVEVEVDEPVRRGMLNTSKLSMAGYRKDNNAGKITSNKFVSKALHPTKADEYEDKNDTVEGKEEVVSLPLSRPSL